LEYPFKRGAGAPQLIKTIDPATGLANYSTYIPPMPGSGKSGQILPTGVPAALGPGQKESLLGRAKDEQEIRDETLKDAGTSQYNQAILQRMKEDADSIYQGPLSKRVYEIESLFRLVDPRFTGPVGAYEDMIKNAGQLTRTATREVSSRAAYQEVQFIQNTLPNPDMSPKGFRSVTDELMGLNDYKQAKAKAMSDWEMAHGGVGRVEGFESDWQAHAPITPYTFIINRMDQPERKALFAKWNQTAEGRAELQRLHAQTQFAVDNGLMR